MLTLEEFAAKCLWLEHIRLREYISEHEANKHFRKTLNRIKRGDLGLSPRTEWTTIVENWYAIAEMLGSEETQRVRESDYDPQGINAAVRKQLRDQSKG